MRSASDGKPEKSLVGPAGRRGGLAALTAGQRRVAACRFCVSLNSESAVGHVKAVRVSEKRGVPWTRGPCASLRPLSSSPGFLFSL